MKSAAISRFVVAAAIAALVVLGGSTPLLAQVNFSPDFSTAVTVGENANLFLNGSATINGSILRLTQDQAGQAGSAWFMAQQSVKSGFSTTFQFQFTREGEHTAADGIAFVIQNSNLQALGAGGGSIGYADGGLVCGNTPCGHDNAGIPNSLAIEFDTFNNGAATADPNGNHIAVQSCGISQPNSNAHGENPFGFPVCIIGGPPAIPVPTMSDGAIHTVVISYTPCADCLGTLTVKLDGSNVLTTAVTLEDELNLTEDGKAWVGFTSATGAAFENHDIRSWTFSPSQTIVVPPNTLTDFDFQGGFGDPNVGNGTGYNYNVLTGTETKVKVTPILKTRAACEALLQQNFAGANCFSYHNPDGANGDFAVMFAVTCPDLGGECDPLPGELGSDYHFKTSANLTFNATTPFPGWLKGHGPSTDDPCQPDPLHIGALFQSNQISSFTLLDGDPPAKTKGGSGGTGSCWVATYNTPGETLPGITITSPQPLPVTYTQGQAVPATFTCSNPSSSHLPQSNPANTTGPYLTLSSCTATPVDTSTVGLHTFTVTAIDSGLNTATKSVSYSVLPASADVAILNLATPLVRPGGKITYVIGVGDLGPADAVGVVVTDTLPSNTSWVSTSAKKVSCAIVNKKLVCTTTTISCSGTSTVSCNVGTLGRLSLSSLNGATIQITVQVASTVVPNKTTIKNTATVVSGNDPKASNNSSTASTLVIK
jgi:uncharacterized repeat protein (TIGR01451 family)